MGAPISLFPRYKQRENLATNYVLLLLRQFYQEKPLLLREFLNFFLEPSIADDLGLNFEQQVKGKNSIPDGLILQSPFSLHIETKTSDWFYYDQVKRHLEGLKDDGITSGKKIFLALTGQAFNTKNINNIAEHAARDFQEIDFFARTFEDFLEALNSISSLLNPVLLETTREFEKFCRDEGLIQNWKGWLDVVSASDSIKSCIQNKAYFFPTGGGAYSHDRCEYLGLYKNKNVAYVARIRALIEVSSVDDVTVIWSNEKNDLSKEAVALCIETAQKLPLRVFLLDEFSPLDFQKISARAMQQHKRYFNLKAILPTESVTGMSSTKLASVLNGKTWK